MEKRKFENMRGDKNPAKRPEVRKKISESLKGNIPWNKGLHNIYTEETKKKISDSRKRENAGQRLKEAHNVEDLIAKEYAKYGNVFHVSDIGFPDLIIVPYGVKLEFLEVKSGNAVLTQNQKFCHRTLLSKGHCVKVVRFRNGTITEYLSLGEIMLEKKKT